MERLKHLFLRLFDTREGPTHVFLPRWLFLRALAAIYFSAFFSLLFQIKGLIGPHGILPAGEYLADVTQSFGLARFWFAPSLFWISASSHALMTITWLGLVASIAALFNLWPRLSFFACFVCFLSFVSTASDFSGYQSDGMLLEAGFLALFFAPPGLRPGLAPKHPPPRAALWLLQWEWFRIYFESGLAKLLSGDRQWRTLTAMDEYYQNGPLPAWPGWYVEHLPHLFHVATAAGTLAMELLIALMLFLPRRARLVCFLIVTPWEIGVILTGNYAFLNYIVLSLGVLLLEDTTLRSLIPTRFRPATLIPAASRAQPLSEAVILSEGASAPQSKDPRISPLPLSSPTPPQQTVILSEGASAPQPKDLPPIPPAHQITQLSAHTPTFTLPELPILRISLTSIFTLWIAYATTARLVAIVLPNSPLPTTPIAMLEPFRIANQYGLFAVMTRGRYEIEFQGSNDNLTWTPYPFCYKPQALNAAPGLYAPYQPRFDWNLWFASLGEWRQNQLVPVTEERLLDNDPDVLALFRYNPFPQSPPKYVRAVLYQYWFTTLPEKRLSGNWWRRQLLGDYAPTLTRTPDGHYLATTLPSRLPPHD
jgi:hypothetical protein